MQILIQNIKFTVHLIKAGMYTTDAEGKFKYELEANKVNLIMFLFVFYC
jgi:hypothetical protein